MNKWMQKHGHIKPMVIYDLILVIWDAVGMIFRNGKGIDRLFLKTGRKKLDLVCSRFNDAQFSHAGAQGAAIEPEDLCSPVFPAHLPLGLLKYPENIVTLDLIQRFLGRR